MAFQLTAGSGGSLWLSWLEPAAVAGAHRLRAARFADGGWSPAVTVVEGGSFFANWADVPAVAEARDGLVATWLEKLGSGTYAYGLALARSADGGATWERAGWLHADTSPTEHGFVTLLPGGDGVRAVWLDGRETEEGRPMTLRTAIVTADGVRDERVVDDAVCDCCNTAAARVGDGVLVAYRDRSAEELRDIAVARLPASGEAPPQQGAFPRDGWVIPACPVNGPAVTAEGDGVAVAWYTAQGERPRVQAAFSADGGATFAPPVVVDGEAPWGRVGIALDGDGGAVVSWLAAAEGENAEVRLRRVRDGRLGAPLTVATTRGARSSGVPRLARLGDELYVAWRDDAANALRLTALPVTAVPPVP